MEARLMPHAQYVAVLILVDGQLRAAKAFEHQSDALRWAEEQRVINLARNRTGCRAAVSLSRVTPRARHLPREQRL
jgi:hypothetical protein